jgi:hypothetical protein
MVLGEERLQQVGVEEVTVDILVQPDQPKSRTFRWVCEWTPDVSPA